jgi:O-antigen/teichoic acid export membrane protein
VSKVRSQLMRGSLWLTGGRVVTSALAFVSTIVLARLLSPYDFGIVALGTTILAIVTSVTEMSLSQALIQHRDPQPSHFDTAWTLSVARGLGLASILALAAVPMALVYDEPRLELVIYALAISVFVSGLANPRRVMLARQLVFWQEAMLSISQRLTTVVVSITIAWIWQSYWALVIGTIAGQVINTALSYVVLPFRPKIAWLHTRELWSFSIWLTLGQAINTINWRFDQLLVGGLIGRVALGYYSVGDNLAQMPTREATTPLRQALFPALARTAMDPERLRSGYQRAQAIVTLIALPAGVGFALIARPIIVALMGVKWLPAVPIVQTLSAVFALQTLGSLVQPLGMAKGETKLLFKRDLQMFFFRLPVIIGSTLVYGLPGLIGARVFTGLLATYVNMRLVRQFTSLAVRDQLIANWRTFVAILVMTIITFGVQILTGNESVPSHYQAAWQIAASVLAGGSGYVGTLFVCWIFSGFPDGPERELFMVGKGSLARFVNRIRHRSTN